MKKNYLSTPIYYPNSVPHVGHLYSTLIADIWKKASNLLEQKSFITTGLDEHGQKVAQAAEKRGYSAQEHVDFLSNEFITFFKEYNLNWDFWVRTTDIEHKNAAQSFWQTLSEKGYIYKGEYSGWYSISDETYLSNPPEEENANIVWRQEECYYFKLSALEEKLKKFYEEHPESVFPKTRYNEVLGFLDKGLKDFVISRPKSRLYWGIEVPDDADHVMYVWVDALVNYLSSIGYPDKTYQNLWPGTHILGKDILKFHAIYWPAMLIAADIEPMEKLIVHGWWLNGEDKISKSLGNAVDLTELIEKYQSDGIRYFLIKGIDIGEDGQFKEELLRSVVYGDLANKFGNIFLRVLGLIEIRFNGKLPNEATEHCQDCEFLSTKLSTLREKLTQLVNQPETVSEYARYFFECVLAINDCFQTHKVWEIKDDKQQAEILYFLMNSFKKLSVLAYPIIPDTSLDVMKFFGFNEISIKNYDKPVPLGFFESKPKFFPKNS